jgi:hypothetical protein
MNIKEKTEVKNNAKGSLTGTCGMTAVFPPVEIIVVWPSPPTVATSRRLNGPTTRLFRQS